MRLWVRWSARLCLSFMLWAVAAESSHCHPSQTNSGSCLICVVAHSASPAPNSADTTPVFATVDLLQEEAVVANVRLEFSDSGNRGPPTL